MAACATVGRMPGSRVAGGDTISAAARDSSLAEFGEPCLERRDPGQKRVVFIARLERHVANDFELLALHHIHGVEQPLTPRERDVIALLAEGLSNKEIGCRLGISPDTAKFHVGRVIDKLDATGRTDAVAHAARRGIIHL